MRLTRKTSECWSRRCGSTGNNFSISHLNRNELAQSVRNKPLILIALFLLVAILLLSAGIVVGKSGNLNGCIRLFLLALLLTGIGTISNLVLTVVLFGKHQNRIAILHLLGLAILLALSVSLRIVIIRVVGFDLPTALAKALISGKLPDGSPMP